VVDAGSQHFLWTALHWAAVTLNQAERVRASFEPYRASILSRPDGVVIRVTPEMERPGAIFWADVHFLMIAVKHLDGVLLKLTPVSRARWQYERRVAAYISTSKRPGITTSGTAPAGLAGT
jgi:hypothetical protein